MKLSEKNPNPVDILGEEINPSETIEENKNINESDFVVSDFEDDEKKPVENNNTSEDNKPKETIEETKKVVEKTETVSPDGSSTTQTTITETTNLNEVKARQIKPNMGFLMWDRFAPEIGTFIFPKTPREHWKFQEADKKDLSILITETAKEENWNGIPTKYFLLLALAAIILMKVRTRNEISTSNQKEVTQEYHEERELKQKLSEMENKLEKLMQHNEMLRNELTKKMGSAYYQEIPQEEIKQVEKLTNEAKQIIENIYNGYDLDKIRFSINGGFADRTQAGQKGYNAKGVKIGTPSAEMKDLFNKWKQYHEVKSGEVPYFVV